MRALSYISSFLASLLLLEAAAAQDLLFHYDGLNSGDRLGGAFDVVGDVNGDGILDLVCGHPDDDTGGVNAGRVDVRSGADGSLLHTVLGSVANERFGATVSDAGDVNGDGTPDFVAGSPDALGGKGAAWVYSGVDASQLLFLRGEFVGDAYAVALDAAGDVDADGRADVVIGAGGYDDFRGAIYVVSGATGSLIFKREGLRGSGTDLYFARYGSVVTGAGDLDGDGHADLFVEARDRVNCLQRPYYEAVSGADGSRIRWDQGSSDCGHDPGQSVFGVSSAGDADGDGRPDYLVGSGTSIAYSYAYELVSGATGAVLGSLDASGYQPGFSRPVGDVDGDGTGDYAVVLLDRNFGELTDRVLRVHSGATLALLQSIPTPYGAQTLFGTEVRGIGDWNGDGFDDLAVGGPDFETLGSGRGRIWVFSGAPAGSIERYCRFEATNSSAGRRARMEHEGGASVTANDLGLGVLDLPGSTSVVFIRSPDEALTPLGDGFLCLGSSSLGYVVRMTSGASTPTGTFHQPFDTGAGGAPAELVTPGSVWNFQAWFRDPGISATGFNFSDAMRVTWAP